MNYNIEMLDRYFKFSSRTIANVQNKRKNQIRISGKIRKEELILFGVCCLMFTFFAIAKDMQGEKNINVIYVKIIGAIIAILIVFIKSRIVFGKLEHKPTNINIYQRELPSKLKPAHVRMLMHDGLIDSISLASTILDLIDRGYLKLEKLSNTAVDSKIEVFGNNTIILKRTNKTGEELLKYEKYIMDWFINEYGNGEQVDSRQVHNGLKNRTSNGKSPSEMFEEWQALVIMSFPLKQYYNFRNTEKMKKRYIIYVLIGFLSPIIGILSSIGLFLGIYGIGNLFFATPNYVLNQVGADEKDSWMDLKKYLEEFADMKNKNAEMVVLWNYYLTYAIALDVKTIAKEEIEEFFGENIYYEVMHKVGAIENTNTFEYIEENNRNEDEIKAEIEQEIEGEMKKYNIL